MPSFTLEIPIFLASRLGPLRLLQMSILSPLAVRARRPLELVLRHSGAAPFNMITKYMESKAMHPKTFETRTLPTLTSFTILLSSAVPIHSGIHTMLVVAVSILHLLV